MAYSLVPYDFEGDLPDDFWEHYFDDGELDGLAGYLTDYPDVNPANGIADFVDAYNGSSDGTLATSEKGDTPDKYV